MAWHILRATGHPPPLAFARACVVAYARAPALHVCARRLLQHEWMHGLMLS